MVNHVRVHQIVTAVEPAGLTLEALIFQVLDYRLIDRKAIGYKTLDGRVPENPLLLQLMAS